MLRLFNGLFAILFTFGAAVQVNDPDPLRWVLVYLAAAVACLLGTIGRLPWQVPAGLAVVAAAWAATLASAVVGRVELSELVAAWEMKDLRIEQGREMYGLLIIAAWMLLLAVTSWRRQRLPPGASRSVRDKMAP